MVLRIDNQLEDAPSSLDEEAIISSVLKEEHATYPLEISLTYLDTTSMQELNRDIRGVDKPTDVISIECERPCSTSSANKEMPWLLGDIIICPEVVRQEAAQLEEPYLYTLAHMLIHGTLHLLGYDHVDDSDADVMEEKEERYLRIVGA